MLLAVHSRSASNAMKSGVQGLGECVINIGLRVTLVSIQLGCSLGVSLLLPEKLSYSVPPEWELARFFCKPQARQSGDMGLSEIGAYYRGLNNYHYYFGVPYYNYNIKGPKTLF